ncbi:MAG: PIN domain-containing protein, partial [Fibrobacter sp.]|nr:PIN domain-containing protein [Fibrobacter sp.]
MINYVLDTTVLLYDAQALFSFGKNSVIIPITVIEDIDHFKKDVSEIGRSARQTSRIIDELRKIDSITSGIPLKNGGILSVKTSTGATLHQLPDELRDRSRDNMILAIALDVQKKASGQTIFVSKDMNLRIKANALGLDVEDYESENVDIEELYSGHKDITVSSKTLSLFNENGLVSVNEHFFPNQYVTLISNQNCSIRALGRYDSEKNEIVKLTSDKQDNPWRITPRNREQIFALDALLNDEIQLVTLIGKAGTGKTLLAVAASLYKTVDENVYSRILVSRPTLPMGKDIGFLPGTVEEKLTPWMYPIVDNVELIMRRS